ncbi:MAG TPA: SEL1-like repeat protein, partial [Opitutales bacterium]|nr:SEL1-like repeat protein [Opitutales bacterium]
KGHPEAQLLLGDIYRDGEIILADPIEAVKWYNLSANNGSSKATTALQKLTANLSQEELDDVQRRIQLYSRETGG